MCVNVGVLVGVAVGELVGVGVSQNNTVTGDVASIVVPSPNWPKLFRPQQFRVQLSDSEQLWNPPVVISSAADMPLTSV